MAHTHTVLRRPSTRTPTLDHSAPRGGPVRSGGQGGERRDGPTEGISCARVATLVSLACVNLVIALSTPVEASFTRVGGGTMTVTAWTPGTPQNLTMSRATSVGSLGLCTIIDNELGLKYRVSGGGTWTSRQRFVDPTNFVGTIEVYWTVFRHSVSTIAFDANDNGAESGGRVSCTEFSGQHATPFTVTPVTALGSGDVTPDIGPITTTANPSLLYAITKASGGANATYPGSPWSLELDDGSSIVFYRQVTIPTSYTASPTLDGAGDSIGVLVAVDGAAGAGFF